MISSVNFQNNEVHVFESLPSKRVFQPGRKSTLQALCILKMHMFTLLFPNVQFQQGFDDCGLFAIAFSVSLCYGEDQCCTVYFQHKLWQHLI